MSGRHDLNHIDEHGQQLVLVCECGWRSEPALDAAFLGAQWDDHRQEARVSGR